MSKPANKIQEITTAQFDELLKEQTTQYNKWSDLEENKIYTVTNTKMVYTQYGKSMMLTLLNNCDVWAPEKKLKHRICNGDIKSEMRSFKSKENIHKKEGGSYYVVSPNIASSVTL